MGLRQTISQWIATTKDALDFGPEFPAAIADHHVRYTEELTKLQHLLEQTQQAAREKDELIARLEAAGAVQGNMIVDESAYFVKKDNLLDGPFCLSCFQHNHEVARIVPAPQPKEAEGNPSEWVQCGQCQTPFRAERLGEYLNPAQTAATGTTTPSKTEDQAKPVKARKPRSQTRPSKSPRPEPAKASVRRRAAR